MELHTVGNRPILKESALIEASNLKVCVLYVIENHVSTSLLI